MLVTLIFVLVMYYKVFKYKHFKCFQDNNIKNTFYLKKYLFIKEFNNNINALLKENLE